MISFNSCTKTLVGIQQGIRENTLEIESNDFEKLLGRRVTPIREVLTQIVNGITPTK